MTLITGGPSASTNITFSGLRSRWTTPTAWHASTALRSWPRIRRLASSLSAPPSRMSRCSKSPPPQSSLTIQAWLWYS